MRFIAVHAGALVRQSRQFILIKRLWLFANENEIAVSVNAGFIDARFIKVDFNIQRVSQRTQTVYDSNMAEFSVVVTLAGRSGVHRASLQKLHAGIGALSHLVHAYG